MYYTPRDCPRACFCAGPSTTEADRETWLHGLDPPFVMCIETDWLERLREARLYRYTMPVETFEPGPGGTHWVSRETIEPLAVGPMGDVLTAIADAAVELRITPRLGPLWRRVTTASTLEFSGTRLRNAIGHPTEFG